MSDMPPEEVEQAVEPVPVGLPKSMQAFTRQQMVDFIASALRKSDGQSQSPDGQ
jgi:hypothetical protein